MHVSQISEDFVSDVAETGIKVGDEVKVPARSSVCGTRTNAVPEVWSET